MKPVVSVTLSLPSTWWQESEYSEDSQVYHLTAEASEEGPVENNGVIDIFLSPLPEGSNSRKACEESFVEVFGLPGDREEYDENIDHYVFPTTFQGKDAYWYEGRTEIMNSPMRVICCEIITGQLMILQLSHETDKGLQEVLKLAEKNLTIK